MDDRDLIARIGELVTEEHALETQPEHLINQHERARLQELEVALDQCWDLLRQRRARRNAGLDPDEAAVRDPGTVEGYRQ
jgi:hypothetical protein